MQNSTKLKLIEFDRLNKTQLLYEKRIIEVCISIQITTTHLEYKSYYSDCSAPILQMQNHKRLLLFFWRVNQRFVNLFTLVLFRLFCLLFALVLIINIFV